MNRQELVPVVQRAQRGEAAALAELCERWEAVEQPSSEVPSSEAPDISSETSTEPSPDPGPGPGPGPEPVSSSTPVATSRRASTTTSRAVTTTTSTPSGGAGGAASTVGGSVVMVARNLRRREEGGTALGWLMVVLGIAPTPLFLLLENFARMQLLSRWTPLYLALLVIEAGLLIFYLMRRQRRREA